MLRTLLRSELSYYGCLSAAAQRMMRSIAVYEFLYPLLSLFVYAFILRKTSDFSAVALYNLGSFLTLPLSFYLNGLLIKRYPIRFPYMTGIVGQGIMACLVFFFSFESYVSLFLYGMLQGIPMGLYWANRSYLSLDITHDKNRVYFTGIESMLGTIASIITPVLIGWTIVLGEHFQLYSIDSAYKALGILSLVILFWGGSQIVDVEFTQPKFAQLRVKHPSPTWLAARMVEIFRGVQSSVYIFFAPLATFIFFGQEESLGTLQSVAAVIGAVIIYFLARQLRPSRRLRTLQVSVVVLVALSVLFVMQFSALTALAYLLLMSTLYKVQWITSHPITMRVIDEEEDGDATNNYAYVCDREVYLNIGRTLGVVMFLGVIWWQTQAIALRVLPIFAALMQIGLATYVAKMDKSMATDQQT